MSRSVQIAVLALLLAMPAAGANWINYVDDFSTNKVQSDASLYSAFYESGANPLAEPYLQYHVGKTTRGVAFMAYGDQPAALGYCLSYDAAQSRRMITGTFSVDVSFPCDAEIAQSPPGELNYATSLDGIAWSQKQPLWTGRQTIPIRSTEGKYYILFSGDRAKIDDVRVTLSNPTATWRVPGNFPTIQQAIDGARNGDIIEVGPGTYAGAGNRDIDFRGKRVTLRSTNGPQSTVIVAGDGHQGFRFHQNETSDSVLSGFTIRGGRLTGSTSLGGGIGCEESSPTLIDCIIEDCVASLGGGFGCIGGEPIVIGCTIRNCEARTAGAGVYLFNTSATISGCTISGNTTSGVARGGGVYGIGDSLDATIDHCVISGNSAAGGAGVFVERFSAGSPSCRVAITHCTITRNQLTSGGSAGGVDASDADVTILNSIVWANDGSSVLPSYAVSVSYSDIEGGYWGEGNIDADPLFADFEYHLRVSSPCVDAGDPSSPAGAEPSPNGSRINMGAYGGTVEATQGIERAIFHVNVQSGRDWNDGRSQSRAFATIQAAIDAASDGDTILVWPGVYREEITFLGKAITVQSAADAAVIRGGDYACTFNMAESSDSVLSNFVITGCSVSGVYCDAGASPTLKNLTIVKNQSGVVAYGGADPTIVNCIIWANTKASLSAWGAAYNWRVSYSCVEMTAWDAKSTNVSRSAENISVNPQFADINGDYHLRSPYGRYVSATGRWTVEDTVISPCIDGGDPSDDPRNEPADNGGLINMGAYGGTRYASKSGVSACQ